MRDAQRATDWAPRSVRRAARALDAASARTTARVQRCPREREIAAAMGVSLAEYQRARTDRDRVDLEVYRDARDADGPASAVADEMRPADPHDAILALDARRALDAAIARLRPDQRRLIRATYTHGRTLRAIGAARGVGEARACQLRRDALAALRRDPQIASLL